MEQEVQVRVRVKEGDLEGRLAKTIGGKKYCSFRGVPFAEPPVKELRFQPPVPVKPWSGIKQAKKDEKMCAQMLMTLSSFSGEENCLYLNVHTPNLPSKNKENTLLPVMVFLHGGGFVSGSGQVEYFGPDFFIENDVILITMNYRLGVLGFLCLDIPEVAGNMGLKDQNLALKWIKDNVNVFNGDPNNVTLFGISAGAASAEYHMLSPMSQGLFQKTILQSGSALNPWARTRSPIKIAHNLAKKLKIEFKDDRELFEELCKVDVQALVSNAFMSSDPEAVMVGEIFTFTPVVEKCFDGVQSFLTEEPMKSLKDGRFVKVPTINGFCQDEGSHFKVFYDGLLEDMKKNNLKNNLPIFAMRKEDSDRFIDLYDLTTNGVSEETLGYFLSDSLFLSGVYTSLMHRIGYNENQFVYHFAYDGSINYLKTIFDINQPGTVHGDDTSYLALTSYVNEENATSMDKLVRKRMVEMWTDFARTGNPTPAKDKPDELIWPTFTNEKKQILRIDAELSLETVPWISRAEVWKSFLEQELNE